MHISSINVFNFQFLIFLCLLHVSKPRVHLQADSCTYRFGTAYFTCISISSLVGRTVVWYNTSIYNRVPEDEPSGSNHVEDIKK